MSGPDPSPQVHLTREIEASPDTVWSILTTPALFSSWMDGQVEFEALEGSPFRAAFPQFRTVVAGEIVLLDAGARVLRMTWGLEEGSNAEAFPTGCSLLEFRVHEAPAGCRVEVSHSRLPSPSAASEQEQGWTFHLSRLSVFSNRSDLRAGLERTLPEWFTAWNEPDDAPRERALRSCCAADIEFRDDWAVATGIDLLSRHIANCFLFMPDWKIEPTSDVRICRGEALVGWRSTGPGGVTLEGHNHVVARYDGTLVRVAGFRVSTSA